MGSVLSQAETIRLSEPEKVARALRYLNRLDEQSATAALSPGGRVILNRRVLRSILQRRTARGEFKNISEIATIRGIGTKTLVQLFEACATEIADHEAESRDSGAATPH